MQPYEHSSLQPVPPENRCFLGPADTFTKFYIADKGNPNVTVSPFVTTSNNEFSVSASS